MANSSQKQMFRPKINILKPSGCLLLSLCLCLLLSLFSSKAGCFSDKPSYCKATQRPQRHRLLWCQQSQKIKKPSLCLLFFIMADTSQRWWWLWGGVLCVCVWARKWGLFSSERRFRSWHHFHFAETSPSQGLFSLFDVCVSFFLSLCLSLI